jgi:peroxiredoxin
MKLSKLIQIIPLAALCAGSAFAVVTKPFIKEGVWRGVFTVAEQEVPFNFELKGKTPEDATFTLLNGTRRDEFHVKQEDDGTLFIKMNTYDAAVVAKISDEGHITGVYKSLVPRNGFNDIPFSAEQGKSYRFVEPGKDVAPKANLSGKWAFKVISKDKTLNNVALLKQEGNKLTGVTLAITGDSRELEGTVQGDEFWLAHFSGPSPRLIHGKITEDGRIVGSFGRGIYDNVKFEGVKDDKAELPDLYKLTYLKEGQKSLDFVLPDLDGKPVSLKDEKYKGKVTIVEVIGTWCPNCTDQTVFLAPWFRENKSRGVEAIAVGFEQKDDLEYAKYTLGTLKKKYGIEYDLVFGGIADKKVATEKLKGINYLAAFPTTFVIDRRGDVRQIFTGYTGTVTGEYYKDYVVKFNKLLDELIAEPNPYATPTQQRQASLDQPTSPKA